MKDYAVEYDYHRKIEAALARQQLQNCALLSAVDAEAERRGVQRQNHSTK